MAIYGVDAYGKALYGAVRDVGYTVANLTAVQSDYGAIALSWDAAPLADWTTLTLVRSGYGFPVAVTDGTTLITFPVNGLRSDYTDRGLPPGYWYYTFFLATPFPAWSASLTYATGDRVSYSGQVWDCLVPYSVNVTPGSNGNVWSVSYETTLYRAAGSIACMSVRDYGYASTLLSLVPSPYQQLPGTSTDSADVNTDLNDFLSILGFGFAQIHTELDDLLEVDDVFTTRQDRLYELSQTLGLDGELASSARYQRLRTHRAAVINQEKGTVAGIVDTIHAATGLSATVATGINQVLTQDQSAFATPIPPPWNPAQPYKLGDEVLYLGARYMCTGTTITINSTNYVAQGVTGAPNALGTTTISGTVYIKETNAAGPTTTITIPFTVAATTSYAATILFGTGTDCGILSATLDGVTVQVAQQTLLRGGFSHSYANTYDLYTASSGTTTIGTKSTVLTAGAHTLVLSAAAKNSSATAYDLLFSSLSISGNPIVYPPGNPPTGASTSSAQWSASATYNDTTFYANTATGGMGTWSSVGVSTVLSTGYLGA